MDEHEAWERLISVMSQRDDWPPVVKPQPVVEFRQLGFRVEGKTYVLRPTTDVDYVDEIDEDGNVRHFGPDGQELGS